MEVRSQFSGVPIHIHIYSNDGKDICNEYMVINMINNIILEKITSVIVFSITIID